MKIERRRMGGPGAGGRHGPRAALSPSAIVSASYAVIHALIWLYAGTVLTASGFREFWSRPVAGSVSVLGLSAVLAGLVAAYAAVDTWRTLSPQPRRRWKAGVVSLAGLALQILLMIYFSRIADVLLRIGDGGR